MSIKIEITAETGAEAREKLTSLLGPAVNNLNWKEAAPVRRTDGDAEARKQQAQTLGEAIRAEEAKEPNLLRDPAAAVYHEPAKEPAKRGRPKKTEPAPAAEATPEPQPNISTAPEHRIDPEAEAQDAEDEAAEVAGEPVKTLTAEDLRAITGRYIGQHGIAAAQEDGVKVFADALGTPPEGSDYWTITAAAKSPETLAKAVAAWEAAVAAGKRYGRS